MQSIIQEQLLDLFKEIEYEDVPGFNKIVKNTKEPEEAIIIVNWWEEIPKTQNKGIINIVGKQGQLLKRLEESEELFQKVAFSWCAIYFKIKLYKFMSKYPVPKSPPYHLIILRAKVMKKYLERM